MKKVILWIILPVLSVVFIGKGNTDLFAAGGKAVAIVMQKVGSVKILDKNGRFKSNAAKYSRLYANDIVTTSLNSSCLVLFKDRSTVKLDANSKVLISKVNVGAGSRRGIGLLRGGASIKVHKTQGGTSFSAFSPTAVAGVRGTEFRMRVAPDGSTRLNVTEGSVAFGDGWQDNNVTNAGGWATHDVGSGVSAGQSSGDVWRDEGGWERERKRNLDKNPEKAMKTLESEIKRIEKDNRENIARVNSLRQGGVNRENASGVLEADNDAMRNAARNAAISETANDIGRRYSNRPGVSQRLGTIRRYVSVVDAQIARMDKFIEEMGRKVDELINSQEGAINDLMRNFMRRGTGRGGQ
jgi:hypothetical protein